MDCLPRAAVGLRSLSLVRAGGYAVSRDILVLDLGTFAGLPWSIPLWFVDPQAVSFDVQHVLVVVSALLNVAMLAGLLGFAWVKTNRGAYTDSCNGTWKVCALAGGSLLLAVLGGLGVLYTGSLAWALLCGCAVAVMLPGAMFYLLPWRRVATSLVVVGACIAGLGLMFSAALEGLGNSAY